MSKSARRQRLTSRSAFHALSSSASARLVRADFGSRIRGANPARAVARAGKLVHYLGDDRAVVRTPSGRTKVITSSMPLRSANHGGPKRPIDLALHAARGSFAPANPLVSTSIARRLGGGATVGSPQLKVIPLGHDVEGTSSADSAVFFHGIGTDEDATVTPTLTGVELSTQLRSPQSPQQIGYRLVPPAGASLVAHGTSARVERAGGHVLATVSTPSAIDAQGTPVPVRMSVRGSQLLLEVDHRSREVAYPVLVDPRVVFSVKKSSPGWNFQTCAPECGEGYSGQEIEGPEPGVLTAPVGYYGYGIFSKEDESVNEFCDEFFELVPGAYSCSPLMHKEPEVHPFGIWQWPDENAVGESRVVKTTYEGIAITPGVWAETSRGIGGTGYLGYSVGCYASNNLSEESPPATIESCSEFPFPRVGLGFLQRPYEEVWTGPPVSAGWPSEGTFGFREGEVTDATTLSVEAFVVEEERKPHRRHGPRKRELLGPNSPGDPKLPRSCEGDPVDCATGNLTETQTDIDVPGLGVGLTLARTYNSQAAAEDSWHGPFGYGWSWSVGAHLTTHDDYSSGRLSVTRTVEQGNGSTVAFVEGTPRAGVQATLQPEAGSSGSYLYTLPDQTVMTFDWRGKLASETDPNGNVTKVGETCEGGEEGGGGVASVRMRYASYTTMDVSDEGERTCRIEVKDPSGRVMTLYLNAEELVERATDPMGHTVYYEYEDGELTSVTYPGETLPRWRFKYDSHHRLRQITDGRGHHTSNEYDSSNRVTAQTDPRGDTRHFEYGHGGEEFLEGVAAGAETEAEEYLPEITEEEESFVAGSGGVIAYSPPKDTTTITDDASEAITFEQFDTEDALISQTQAYGTLKAATSEFTYNGAHDLTSTTDGDGHTTDYTYDSAGNRTSRTDADGNNTKWEYDGEHDVVGTTSPNGEHTTIERDGHGNALKVSRPAPGGSQVTEYVYDGYGELTSMTDPLEHVWKYEYDDNGDRIVELSPEGEKRTFEFNADSQEISTTSPRGNVPGADPGAFTTTIERDEQGRVLRVTEPLE